MPGGLIVARTFDREFRFHLPDDGILEALAIHEAAPEAPPPAARIEIRVKALGGGWYDFAPPFDGQPGTATHQADRVRRALGEAMAEEAGTDLLLHAGLIHMEGRRVLLVTPDHAARHRLALLCLGDGIDVETATMVLLRAGEALAWPARVRVLPEWAAGRPALVRRVAASPFEVDWNGVTVHAVSPGSGGGRWRLTAGPADVCVFLEMESGRFADAGVVAPDIAFGRLIEALASPGTRSAGFAMLHDLSRTIPAWRLRLGDPARALWHLRKVAELAACN